MITVSKRLNNKGMTLVELLVSIVILAIIVVPLLHTFVSSARVNMDSKTKLKITTIAQDVMEGLRGDTVEGLAYQIYYPSGVSVSADGITRDGFHIINRDMIKGSISENRCNIDANGNVTGFSEVNPASMYEDEKPCIESTDGGVNYKFKKKIDGKYYFYFSDVAVEAAGTPNYKVDVLISADASRYREGGSVSSDEARHNETPLVDISDMNRATDFVYKINCDDMLSKLNNSYYTSYDLTDMKLSVDFNLRKVNIGGEDRYQGNLDATLSSITGTETYTVSQTVTRKSVRNIYIFYKPTYNGKAAVSTNPDTINITNNDLVDNNLYIVKQYNDSLAASGYLELYEDNYRCDVNLTESGETESHTRIRTNLDYNLHKVLNNSGALTRMFPLQTSFYYNTNPKSIDLSNPLVWKSNGEYVVTSVGGGEASDRIYDVKVYIYEEGSIAGAMTTGEISADRLLVSLDGSMQ